MLTSREWTRERLHFEQLELEREMHDGGVSRFKRAQQRAIEEGEASGTSYNTRLMRELVHPLSQALGAYLDYYKGKPGRSVAGLSKLRLLDPLVSGFIAVKVLLDSVPLNESMQSTAIRLGAKIEDQVRFSKLKETAPQYVNAVEKSLKQARSRSYTHRRNVMSAAERRLARRSSGDYVVNLDAWIDWDKKTRMHVGLALIRVACESLVFHDAPVFRMVQPPRQPYHIQISEEVSLWASEFQEFMAELSPAYAPCVIPPRPWTHPKSGGYYTPEIARTLPITKVRSSGQLGRLTLDRMPEVYSAINSLQRVPWAVNGAILDVAESVIKADLALGVPQREPYTPNPSPVPDSLQGLAGDALRSAMNPEQLAEFIAWRRESADVYRAERKRAAMYLEVGRTVAEARKFRAYPALYFVYTTDSRGRVYARQGCIGPQGGDLQKALVNFATAKPLGDRGRYWLAVHGAGVWGNDKVSFDERVRFIEEDMRETIKDIVADPLTFRDWLDADKPWQFLAWCFEWEGMLGHVARGGAHRDYQSRIPVAMDGSCSGIQHYSAMLQDRRGGDAVNLTNAELPQDIYGEVAKVVRRWLEKIATGEEYVEIRAKDQIVPASKLSAMARAWLDFGIDRKVCKKPVMTLPLA